VNTSESWDVNCYSTPRDAIPRIRGVAVNWLLAKKRRSASPYGNYGSGRILRFLRATAATAT